MARRIKKADIEFISLVPAGANKFRSIYKADGSCELETLSKLNDQGELTAVVYAPEHRDSQGDIADAAVIKDAARGFIAKGAKIDIRHDGKPVDAKKAYVAESFIIHKGDERFDDGWEDKDGNAVDLTGAWATVIQLEDPDLRDKYRSGEWQGVSMGGTAIVEQEKEHNDGTAVNKLCDLLSKALTPAQTQPTPNEEDDMTPEQLTTLTKALTDGFDALGNKIEKSIETKLGKSDEGEGNGNKPKPNTEEPKEPVFKGSRSDGNALRKHAIEVQLFRLEKETDLGDPDQVEEYLEKTEELREELDELKKASKESRGKVRKAGKAGGGDASHQAPVDAPQGISKADLEAMGAGMVTAGKTNDSRYGTKQEA